MEWTDAVRSARSHSQDHTRTRSADDVKFSSTIALAMDVTVGPVLQSRKPIKWTRSSTTLESKEKKSQAELYRVKNEMADNFAVCTASFESPWNLSRGWDWAKFFSVQKQALLLNDDSRGGNLGILRSFQPETNTSLGEVSYTIEGLPGGLKFSYRIVPRLSKWVDQF